MHHAPDAPVLDDALRVLEGRVADVVVAQHGHDPGRPGRGLHLFGVGQRQRHRFLAPDVFARLKRGKRHLAVEVVRRCDADDIDRRVGHQRPPVVGGPGKAELRRHLLCLCHWRVAEHLHANVGESASQHRAGVAPPQGVRLAHEPRADHTHANPGHLRTPPVCLTWRSRSHAAPATSRVIGDRISCKTHQNAAVQCEDIVRTRHGTPPHDQRSRRRGAGFRRHRRPRSQRSRQGAGGDRAPRLRGGTAHRLSRRSSDRAAHDGRPARDPVRRRLQQGAPAVLPGFPDRDGERHRPRHQHPRAHDRRLRPVAKPV